jgi:protein-tyrosine phosphatase
LLEKKQIGFVVTVAIGQPLTLTAVGHKVYPIEDNDRYNVQKHFNEFNRLLDHKLKETSVLVHCAAGISRSPTFIIAYLMHREHLSFLEAYALVKQKRHIIKPNENFLT